VRRQTIEVIRYRRVTFVRDCTSDPADSRLAHSFSEQLAAESERLSVPTVVSSKPSVPDPITDSVDNWLIKRLLVRRLLGQIATFRNHFKP
jgi:hypothetical protein